MPRRAGAACEPETWPESCKSDPAVQPTANDDMNRPASANSLRAPEQAGLSAVFASQTTVRATR